MLFSTTVVRRLFGTAGFLKTGDGEGDGGGCEGGDGGCGCGGCGNEGTILGSSTVLFTPSLEPPSSELHNDSSVP